MAFQHIQALLVEVKPSLDTLQSTEAESSRIEAQEKALQLTRCEWLRLKNQPLVNTYPPLYSKR